MDIVVVKSTNLVSVETISLKNVVGGYVLEVNGVDQAVISVFQKDELRIKPLPGNTLKIVDSGYYALEDDESTTIRRGDAIRIGVLNMHGLSAFVVENFARDG